MRGGGSTHYKRPYVWMGHFFTILPEFKLTRLKSKKNPVILLKILRKIGPIGYEWATFSWKKMVFVWVYFQNPWWHIPTKPKLEYPSAHPGPGLHARIIKCWPNRLYWRFFFFVFFCFCFVLFVCLFGCCCCFFLVCSSSLLYVMIFGWKKLS